MHSQTKLQKQANLHITFRKILTTVNEKTVRQMPDSSVFGVEGRVTRPLAWPCEPWSGDSQQTEPPDYFVIIAGFSAQLLSAS